MKISDRIFALLFLLLSGGMFLNARTLPEMPGQPVGPAVFPMTIAVIMGFISIAIFARAWKSPQSDVLVTFSKSLRSVRTVIALLLVPGSVVFYLLCADRLGFITVSVVSMFVLMLAFGTALRIAALVSVLISLVCFLLFRGVLLVPLPETAIERTVMGVLHVG